MQSLKDVIQLNAVRWMAFQDHVPGAVIYIIAALGLLSVMVVGDTFGLSGHRQPFSISTGRARSHPREPAAPAVAPPLLPPLRTNASGLQQNVAATAATPRWIDPDSARTRRNHPIGHPSGTGRLATDNTPGPRPFHDGAPGRSPHEGWRKVVSRPTTIVRTPTNTPRTTD